MKQNDSWEGHSMARRLQTQSSAFGGFFTRPQYQQTLWFKTLDVTKASVILLFLNRRPCHHVAEQFLHAATSFYSLPLSLPVIIRAPEYRLLPA
jgi:hypothetical protein